MTVHFCQPTFARNRGYLEDAKHKCYNARQYYGRFVKIWYSIRTSAQHTILQMQPHLVLILVEIYRIGHPGTPYLVVGSQGLEYPQQGQHPAYPDKPQIFQ